MDLILKIAKIVGLHLKNLCWALRLLGCGILPYDFFDEEENHE